MARGYESKRGGVDLISTLSFFVCNAIAQTIARIRATRGFGASQFDLVPKPRKRSLGAWSDL